MFFRTTFLVVFQLPHDDIFRRREQDCLSCQDIALLVSKGPGMQLASMSEVEVSFQTRISMDDIEMAVPLTRHFLVDSIEGRQIKLRRRIDLCKPLDVLQSQEHDQVHVVGHTRLTVQHGRNTASHEVTDTQHAERMHEQLDQVRFGHAEKYGAPLAQPAARTNRGVGSAGMRSCAGAWSNKACERLANAALASCGAALRSAQGWPVHPPT